MHSLFNVSPNVITPLSPEESVSFFTVLLNAECFAEGLNPSALTISANITVPDGGIDAEVRTGSHLISDMAIFKHGRTGFQIKAGSSFTPWRESSIKTELLNSEGNLHSEVDNLIRDNGHYIVLCTGHDLTPEQRNAACDHIRKYFPETYTGEIDVLGSEQIATFASRYPGTARILTGISLFEAQTIEEWELQDHMSNPFEISEDQTKLINQIRDLLNGSTKHIRILGEPGLGKTRIVLETLRMPELSPQVLYYGYGARFAQTDLFRELLKFPDSIPLILVLDDLRENELKDVWDHLKRRCGKLKVISLDHGIDKFSDSDIQTFFAPQLKNETIVSIMRNKLGELQGLERWAEICEGSPRVALAVADNLRQNPDDILKEPSTVPLWDRFIQGHTSDDFFSEAQVNCIATHLALYSRFGFEHPLTNEAKFISQQIKESDPSIGWGVFQSIIKRLRNRRVLQGKKTLFFVPKALHIYLWRQYWEGYGRGFNFSEVILNLPDQLRVWFMSMFKYAEGPATEPLLDEILKVDGFFSYLDTLCSNRGAEFLSILAESAPEKVLSLLESTIAQWSDDELLEFDEGRQYIVWALEKIAVRSDLIVRVINVLARLAVNENDSNRNNASGILIGLFAIGYEHAATEATPMVRFQAFKKLLSDSDIRLKMLGINASKSAINTLDSKFRIVGPEYQGTRVRANLWTPKTWGDLWDAYLLYLNEVYTAYSDWPTEHKKDICSALLDGVNQLVDIPYCAPKALEILNEIVDQKATDAHELNNFFKHFFEFRANEENKEITDQLKILENKYTSRSISSRYQRYIIDTEYREWDEGYREKKSLPPNETKEEVDKLASEIGDQPKLISEVENLLCSDRFHAAQYFFGEKLAEYDTAQASMPTIIQKTLTANNHAVLSGYVIKLCELQKDIAYKAIKDLLSSKENAWLGIALALQIEYVDEFYDLMIEQSKSDLIPYHLYWSILRPNYAPVEKVTEILNILFSKNTNESYKALLNFFYDKPFDESLLIPSDSMASLIIQCISFKGLCDYEWEQAVKKLIVWKPELWKNILNELFQAMKENFEFTYTSYIPKAANYIVRENVTEAWNIIKNHIGHHTIQHWLEIRLDNNKVHRGIIAVLPLSEILEWIEEELPERAIIASKFAPPTLDDNLGGELTQYLIREYHENRDVLNPLWSKFYTGSWMGPLSNHYREKRTIFRQWLSNGYDEKINLWLEEKIKILDQWIDQEEMKEERTRF